MVTRNLLCRICFVLVCHGGISLAQEALFPSETLNALLDIAYPANLLEGRPDYLNAVPPGSDDITLHRTGLDAVEPALLVESIRWMEKIVKPEFLSPDLANLKQALSSGGSLPVVTTVWALNNYRGLEAKDLRNAIGRSVTLPTGQVVQYPGLSPTWKGRDIIVSRHLIADALVEVRESGAILDITIVFNNTPVRSGVDLIRDVLQRFTQMPLSAITQADMSEVTSIQNVWCGTIYSGISASDPAVAEWPYSYSEWWGLMHVVTHGRVVYLSIGQVEKPGPRKAPSADRF